MARTRKIESATEDKENQTVVQASSAIEDNDAAPTVNRANEANRPNPEDVIKELQQKLEEEQAETRAARERATSLEKERREAGAQVQTAEGNAFRAQEEAIDNALATKAQEIAAARIALRKAYEDGDVDAIADAQEKIASFTYERKRAEDAKTYTANQKKAWEERSKAPQQQQLPPSVQKWIEDHPRYNTDRKYNAVVVAAAQEALESGVAFGSPIFIREITNAIKEVYGTSNQNTVVANEDDHEPTPKPKITAATTAAAVTRTAMNGNQGKRVVRLDEEQREMARVCFPHLSKKDAEEKYALSITE